MEFSEAFTVTVDSQGISDVEKLQYLKSALKGEAASVLAGLPLINSNYKVAMDLLSHRYWSKSVFCVHIYVPYYH